MSLLTKRVKRKPSLTKSRSFHEDYTVNDLPALRRKRTIAYNRLSKALEIGLKSDVDEECRELFLSYYQEVKNTAASFEDTHFTILSIHDAEEEDDDIQERFDDIHFRVISIYRRLTNTTEKMESSQNNDTLSRIRLPKITLPTFDGHIKHWPEFFDTFNALIHISPTLNNTEKFHYLISSLSGDALAVIRPFPIVGDHYHDAYRALTSRYENTRELAFTCWRDILNIEFKVNNAKEFRRSLDAIDENLSILEKLHLPVAHWDFVLIYHMLSKLDSKTRRDFEEKHSGSELPTYKQLKSYLHSKCEALIRDTHFSESSKPVTSNREAQKVTAVPYLSNSKRNLSHTLVVSHEEPKQRSSEAVPSRIVRHCSFCGEDHLISSCKPFAQKSIEERRSIAQEKRWCYNCLKPSHLLKDCTSFFSCQRCKRKHHTLLHDDCKGEVESNENAPNGTKSSLIVSNANTTVLLATALVQITDALGNFHTCRALFDTGSQNNLITEQAAKILNIRPSRVNEYVHGLGDAATTVTGTIRCSIGTNNTPFFRDVDLDVINKICGDQPIAKLNTSGWSHIKSLPLADPGFDMPGPIDLLLGANLFVESLLNGRIKGDSIHPAAFSSVFGWLLLGKTPVATSSLVKIQPRVDNDLPNLVQKTWEIDVVLQDTTHSPEDAPTDHHRTETSRNIVGLPFEDSIEPTFIKSRDIVLRQFCAPKALIRNTLWWAGPPWLKQSENECPIDRSHAETDIPQSEEQKRVVVLASNQNINFIDNLLNCSSSLENVVGIIAYTSRFLSNVRHSTSHRQTLILTSDERHQALTIIVKHIQGGAFASDIVKLNSGQPLPKPFRKLNPFIDPEGILRVGGRISRSGLEYDHKHSALLPGNNILTTRIIESVHSKHCHPGVNTTLYPIVQQFWIVSAKRIIRRCLSECIRCFRTRPQTLQPLMSDLPSFRVNQAKPFSIVGVDFGEPSRIKLGSHRGAKTDKAHLCLFACLTTKAGHLEVFSTLLTEGFIAALRRFVARRGRCSVIHSDCGTNFIGAHNYLASVMEGACRSECLEFTFNPPSAPHFGGVWEIQIKATKSHLYRTVGDQLLTFEELTTLFTQIEALLNSRPLCPINSDPNDITALTPGHLLPLEPLTTVPDPDILDVNINRLNRWQLIQSFHQHFWTRWKNEYLHSLTQRAKWTKTSRPLELNSVVIIKDDNRAPLHWPLGRVVELHPGPDGTVRLATVRTSAHTLIKRPLVKLCPLPVKDC